MLTFNNTQIAFENKSNRQLKKAYLLFKTIENPKFVKFGSKLLNIAISIGFPIKWIIKPTVFEHFCGGENINDCEKTIQNLSEFKIRTILDYSVEGNQNEADFDNVTDEIIAIIEKTKANKNIPFAVFKVSGLASVSLLEKLNEKSQLNQKELTEYENVLNRVNKICKKAYDLKLAVLIDAEESWIQNSIDNIAMDMMKLYNKSESIVYNTLQMYRHDRKAYLLNIIDDARQNNFKIGIKLVRGAYMEKERERAAKFNYPSPIHNDKDSTDNDFNEALKICTENSGIISICAGTHNEKSNLILTELIDKQYLSKESKNFYFAQLLGMSDHISYNLANSGYKVAKYVPYGPIKSVMPYLLRRAEENTSVAGQTGRELSLIKSELKRRKSVEI